MRYSIKYGVWMGFISFIIFVLNHLFNFEGMASFAYFAGTLFVNFLILPIVFFVLACRDTAAQQDVLSFKDAFFTSWLTGIVFSVVLLALNLIYVNIVQPDFRKDIASQMIEKVERNYTTDQESEMSAEELTARKNQDIKKVKTLANRNYSAKGMTQNSLFGALWLAILSAVVALANKKEPKTSS